MSKIFKSLISKTRVFRSYPKQKPTITFYFWWIRKFQKHHLIDLIKSYPMTPISSPNTSYWEIYEAILISSPVYKIFDTGFGVNFAKQQTAVKYFILNCVWIPLRHIFSRIHENNNGYKKETICSKYSLTTGETWLIQHNVRPCHPALSIPYT